MGKMRRLLILLSLVFLIIGCSVDYAPPEGVPATVIIFAADDLNPICEIHNVYMVSATDEDVSLIGVNKERKQRRLLVYSIRSNTWKWKVTE